MVPDRIKHPKEGIHQEPYTAVMPTSHNADQHSMVTQKCSTVVRKKGGGWEAIDFAVLLTV